MANQTFKFANESVFMEHNLFVFKMLLESNSFEAIIGLMCFLRLSSDTNLNFHLRINYEAHNF